ncbi:hypothetical protein C8Q77DRAFT_86036 [Trametes polyzona]|nr:hypothetical protein C8Q77DRAFT_86036 [Trametes polyzona]
MADAPAHIGLFDLPLELRLQIYEHVLASHQHVRQKNQPTNAHLRLLYVCKQIKEEAEPLLRRYVSLSREHQIEAFLLHAPPSLYAQVKWADVANEGRVFRPAKLGEGEDSPLSSLHAVLGRMTALKQLRVFECRQGLPLNLQSAMSMHRTRPLALRFERAMFPRGGPALSVYELYTNHDTRVELFDALPPRALVSLRLSGEILTPPEQREPLPVPALRDLVLHSVQGNFFDRHTVDECFPGARLESFAYALGHRLGFELRNHHLESLVAGHGSRLRRLVLLGCSRLSSTVLSQCLEGLPVLEFFALSLITVDELRSNFVLALPPRLAVFKLQVINAWYAIALKDEERGLCDAIESAVLLREKPYKQVCLFFRTQMMTEDGRQERWSQIARERRVQLTIGPWEAPMMDEL